MFINQHHKELNMHQISVIFFFICLLVISFTQIIEAKLNVAKYLGHECITQPFQIFLWKRMRRKAGLGAIQKKKINAEKFK